MRVLHAPTDIAGQATMFCRVLRNLGVVSHSLAFTKHRFNYSTDIILDLNQYPNVWSRTWRQLRNFWGVLRTYDLFHFHYGGSLLPHNADIPVLKMLGKRVVVHFYGSDVRRASLAPFPELARRNEKTIVSLLRRLGRYADVAIVPDGEIRMYVEEFFPRVEIIPQAVEVSKIPFDPPKFNACPVILHAPSNRNIKGTPYVMRAVDELKRRGHRFEFLFVENVPHQQLMSMLSQADIIVDQLRLGVHGILAVEAMAVGRPVICYLYPPFRRWYPEEVPILSAGPETLAAELETLLRTPKQRIEAGFKGRAYVERYHDAIKVATRLLEIYKSLI